MYACIYIYIIGIYIYIYIFYINKRNKIFRYIPPINSDFPIGRAYQINITENGTENWQVGPVVFRYDVEDYFTLSP